MRNIILVIILSTLICGCGMSENAVQTSSTETEIARPIISEIPTGTSTERPSKTPSVTLSPTTTASHTPTNTPTPTPPPQHVPPVIEIQAPDYAIVGQEIILDASNSFDYDGDPIEFKWTQYHNPNKYTGNEYVTGNDVAIESLNGEMSAIFPNSLYGVSQIRFSPDWPGNYHIQLTTTDDDGKSEYIVTVEAFLEYERFRIKGVALSWCCNNRAMTTGALSSILDEAIEMGVNVVEIAPIACMTSKSSIEILSYGKKNNSPYDCFGQMTDEFLFQVIDIIHNKELRVLLAPQIQGFSEDGFFWTGNIQPSNWAEWFENYREFIIHYAQLAEKKQVEYFQIGNELNSSQPRTTYWINIVDEIRYVYFGEIGLGITNTWFSGWPNVFFWDKLDFIGFHFYIPATGIEYPISPAISQPFSTHPSVEQMRNNFDEILKYALDPIVERTGLPVIVTELGVMNYDGANKTHFNPEGAVIDNQEQADYYDAALQVLSTRDYIDGVIFWALDWSDAKSNNTQLDPRFKPAEEVIKNWFVIKEPE